MQDFDIFFDTIDDYDLNIIGDPRRCSRHPDVVISSPNGMHDAPCGKCEMEIDFGATREEQLKIALEALQDHRKHCSICSGHLLLNGQPIQCEDSDILQEELDALDTTWCYDQF